MEINKEEKKEFNILYEDGIYRILIDTYQFILTKVSVTTREDGTTSSYSTNLGYFSTLGQAFDYLLEILIKDKVKVSENFKKDIQSIKYLIQNHVKVGIAINPDTDIEKVYEILPYVHSVLIMTVFPGKGGQDIIEATIEKIRSLKNYCLENDLDLDIEADGGINDKNADKVVSHF